MVGRIGRVDFPRQFQSKKYNRIRPPVIMGEEEALTSSSSSTTGKEETTTKRRIITLSNNDAQESESKRLKEIRLEQAEPTASETTNAAVVVPVVDVAEHIPPGSRLAVHWDIHDDTTTVGQVTISHWWKATLLPHDGRRVIVSSSSSNNNINNNKNNTTSIAIRVLEYDALPELGYPETSREEVIFVSSSLLINYHHNDASSEEEEPEEEEIELEYKILSHDTDDSDNVGLAAVSAADTTTIVCCSDLEIEDLVNNTIVSALGKALPKFQEMPASMQAIFAENIALKKEKLVTLLRQHMRTKSIVSENDMKLLLAQTMSDV